MKNYSNANADTGHCGEAAGQPVAETPNYSSAPADPTHIPGGVITLPSQSAPTKAKVDRSQFVSKTQPVSSPTEAKQTKFPLRKPGSKLFFRASNDPDARIYADIIEGNMGKAYVLGESVTRDSRLERHVSQVLLVPCSNEKGQAFIWYLKTNGRDWYKSALEMVREAENRWIRIEADSFTQAYRVEYADAYPELAASLPKWPITPSEILDEALVGSAINDDSDPLLNEIVGRFRRKEVA